MRKLRVCIYGGTDLQAHHVDFISALAYEILRSMQAVIVTGGFRHGTKHPHATSVDVAALHGARRFAEDNATRLDACYEACIPEPRLDARPDVGNVVRLSAADGIAVQIVAGTTPLGRRLAMVAGVDMVVTIAGKRHTEVVVEQALDLKHPVLPVPNAGGDSRLLLDRYRARIEQGFGPGALDNCLKAVGKHIRKDPVRAAREVVALLQTARIGRCLVLMPFDAAHDRLYAESIEPAIARHMVPVRLDAHPRSEAIGETFSQAIRSARAVIVDVTQVNENVMFEIGYAHALGLKPLIFTREGSRIETLPLYLRLLNVRQVTAGETVGSLVEQYLDSFRGSRGA